MSVSTALVGPLTFYGFLVATLTYQAAPTYDHRYIFPMALAIGFCVLTSAYFFMYHVFNAQGVVSVIIELVGGLVFLIVILRKRDRKSTRLNSSHVSISYAVFCLKK